MKIRGSVVSLSCVLSIRHGPENIQINEKMYVTVEICTIDKMFTIL